MHTFIIAEAGVNHNGREDLALALVEQAQRSGADAVKFQTFSADKLVRPGAEKAEYQQKATGAGDQHAMLKSLEMSEELHRALFARCNALGIEFMSTPFDESAAEFLVDLGMRRIKIPSGEINNEPFLAFLAKFDLPLILSTGMATIAEITRAVQVIGDARAAAGLVAPMEAMLTILHCTSNYPAAYADVNLRAMQSIGRETGMPIGYSDHTTGIAVSPAAVAMGATVIEKHFTLDRDLPGPDHAASLSLDELRDMVAQIRAIEAALGSAEKGPTKRELPVRALVRRSVTSARAIRRGEVISVEDLLLLRPGNGIPPGDRDKLPGSRAARDIPAGTTLQWSDIE
jgi:N,N'-diacetyllegionaminate synthase